MHKFKLFLQILLLLTAGSFVLQTCSDSSSSDEGDVVGAWNLTKMTMQFSDYEVTYTAQEMDISILLTINEDGTFTVYEVDEGEPSTSNGTWSIQGDKLFITEDGITMQADYTCTSSKLKIWLEDFDFGDEMITVIQEFSRQ